MNTTTNQEIAALATAAGDVLRVAPHGAAHDAALSATVLLAVGRFREAAAALDAAGEALPAGYKAAAFLLARNLRAAARGER